MGSGRRGRRGDRAIISIEHGEKVGVVKVRLYRPFSAEHFLASAAGVPSDASPCWTARRSRAPRRAALSRRRDGHCRSDVRRRSRFTAADGRRRTVRPLVEGVHAGDGKAVFDELTSHSRTNHFTVGIDDDVTHTSLTYDTNFSTRGRRRRPAVFYGLGSDGTVGANKNSIKIIGEETPTTTRRATSSTTRRSPAR